MFEQLEKLVRDLSESSLPRRSLSRTFSDEFAQTNLRDRAESDSQLVCDESTENRSGCCCNYFVINQERGFNPASFLVAIRVRVTVPEKKRLAKECHRFEEL